MFHPPDRVKSVRPVDDTRATFAFQSHPITRAVTREPFGELPIARGFIAALVLLPMGAIAYIRLGLVDSRADIPVDGFDHQNLYIIQHGVRMSGMPAWGRVLPDSQLRAVTVFLAHLDRLPVPVADRWKAGAELPH